MSAILVALLTAAIIASGPRVKPAASAAAQSPTAQPTSPPAAQAGSLAIGSLDMVSETVGWAFGSYDSRGLVVRTTDGGTTWTDVSPKVSIRDPFTVLRAIGPDHVWLGVPSLIGGHRAMTIYRSQDAGKSWVTGKNILLPDSLPNARPLLPSLQFVDVLHGWLTFAFQARDPTSDGVGVYATSDGGADWQLVSVTLDQGGSSTVLGLPIGCDKTGMVFSDPTTGWATAHCADGSMFFYGSKDGGRSWLPLTLAPPPGYPPNWFANCNCGTLPPTFSSSRVGLLSIHSPDFAYITRNAGITWEPLNLPTKYVVEAEFIDAQHGWVNGAAADAATRTIRPDRLYVTSDGGKTWETIVPDHQLAGVVHFVDARDGWLTEGSSNGPPQVYKTVDGGRHWLLLDPRLSNLPQQSA